jgi:hypothetical protein
MTTGTEASAAATGTTPRTRASDAEREAAVTRLHHVLGEGRLTLAEADERVAAAYAAQYRDELPRLLADLPEPASENRAWSAASAPAWVDAVMSRLGTRPVAVLVALLLGVGAVGTAAGAALGSAADGPHVAVGRHHPGDPQHFPAPGR